MKLSRSISTVAIAILCLLADNPAADAQLFGGGGLLGGAGGGFGGGGGLLGGGGGFGGGGFGGGGPMLGGGAPIGGGGFIGGGGGPMLGGGPPIGGGGILGGGGLGGGAPMIRPSLPIAGPGGPGPILGGAGGGGPLAGGGRPLLDLPKPGGGDRPFIDRPLVGNRPAAGNLPDRPLFGNRPALPGNNLRPSQPVDRDRLNDFLDNKPVAGLLPNRDRPLADRPLLDPKPGDQPLLEDRPLLKDRPLLNEGPLLNNRPIVNQPIMPSLGEAVLEDEVRQEIVRRHIERAVHVRERIRDLYYRENHPFVYWWTHMWTQHPVWSWWRVTLPVRPANWSSVSSWCGYSGNYSQPVSYDYTDQGVYANGKQVNVDDQYSQQARRLAAAGRQLLQQKIDNQEAEKLEWLPLGVFALCDSQDGDPTMFLQLAISREGIVAGSFANATNNENLSVQGGVDRESSRLAITIGETDDVVVETGLSSVTKEQASAMIHYQNNQRENWLLVRMAEQANSQETTKPSETANSR